MDAYLTSETGGKGTKNQVSGIVWPSGFLLNFCPTPRALWLLKSPGSRRPKAMPVYRRVRKFCPVAQVSRHALRWVAGIQSQHICAVADLTAAEFVTHIIR